jgi:hypothetical protein
VRRAVVALAALVALTGCQPVLSGVQFRDFYNRYEPQPGSVRLTTPPAITGDPAADDRIRWLATNRGYRLRSQHTGRLVWVAGVPVDERVAGPFRALIDEARRNGFALGAGYGYRPVEQQRSIFLSRIPSAAAIRSGSADGAVNAALMWVAPPGYSKHQSGFTIDFRAAGLGGAAFGSSGLGRWLAADNHAVAKRHGFIPSYPPGAGAQGPEPEPWEYVWVGVPAIDCSLRLARDADRRAFDGCKAITTKWYDLGAWGSVLGSVVTAEAALGDGRGRRTVYSNGSILWTPQTGAHEVHGSIYRQYRAQRGPLADLGYPSSDTRTDVRRRTRYVDFERGRIYSFIADSAAVTVKGGFVMKHESVGGVGGVLGYPRANQARRSTSVLEQRFENGTIYSTGTGWYEVHGSIERRHRSSGGLGGPLGAPRSDLRSVGDGRGSRQLFVGGQILHTAATGAHAVTGSLLEQYLAAGGPSGSLGYPVGEPVRVGDGPATQRFEGGELTEPG